MLHLRVEDLEVERHLRGRVGNVLNFARHLFQVGVVVGVGAGVEVEVGVGVEVGVERW